MAIQTKNDQEWRRAMKSLRQELENERGVHKRMEAYRKEKSRKLKARCNELELAVDRLREMNEQTESRVNFLEAEATRGWHEVDQLRQVVETEKINAREAEERCRQEEGRYRDLRVRCLEWAEETRIARQQQRAASQNVENEHRQYEQLRTQAMTAEEELRRITENNDFMTTFLNSQNTEFEWATAAQILDEGAIMDVTLDPFINDEEEELEIEDIYSMSTNSNSPIDLTEYPWEAEL